MYKKITHTIVEEHFDCPEAVDIASAIENNNSTAPMRFQAFADPVVMPSSQFRTKIAGLVGDLDNRWQNLLNATFDTAYNYEEAIEEAFVNNDELGNFLKSYYGAEFGERVNHQWRSVAMSLLYTWRNFKNNFDNSLQSERLTQLVPPFAQMLSQYNNIWEKSTVEQLFNEWYSSYVSLAEAKKAKNTSAQTNIKSIIASDVAKFSKTLADGIIAQFPTLFT